MKTTNVWKLQDAKARFSEVVRKARSGAPQRVTVHGKDAVVIFDPERFELQPKPRHTPTMADFVAGSKKFRGLLDGVSLERVPMGISPRAVIFDEQET